MRGDGCVVGGGVLWGTIEKSTGEGQISRILKPYGAVRISDFLLRIGSDILQEQENSVTE